MRLSIPAPGALSSYTTTAMGRRAPSAVAPLLPSPRRLRRKGEGRDLPQAASQDPPSGGVRGEAAVRCPPTTPGGGAMSSATFLHND